MSIKDWKDKELNTLLNEKWGFSMNLNKLNEEKKPDFADIDGDGDKTEPVSDAAEDKEQEEGNDNKPKKKTKKGEIPPQLRQHVKGKKKDADEKKDIEEIQMRAGGLGKTPKKETDAAKKQSDKNHAHMRKKMDKSDSLKEGESEMEEIKSMLMQNLTNDESTDAEVKKQVEALAKMIKQKRDKTKPPPKSGGNSGSGAPAQPSMEEQKLRETIRKMIKKKLKK